MPARDVARIGILENRPFNQYHSLHDADFCYFDCDNDLEAVAALFEEVTAWAKSRSLNRVVGPKGFNALDGYGVLIEGFEYRQLMTMMAYNYPYYAQLLEQIHFDKLVEQATRDCKAYLERISGRFVGIKLRRSVELGSAADLIIAKAEATNSALVAMTTHGHSELNRWLLGSVAEKVLRSTNNPLLLILSTPTAVTEQQVSIQSIDHTGGVRFGLDQ